MTVLIVIACYLGLLLALGLLSSRLSRGTSKDYFVASHSIGPFLLLMSVFGTTMTAFALVGSTGKAFERGIGTYGLMASSSGLIHAACFFLIGVKLWSLGKKHGFVTQIQFFRARFESDKLGYLLFPVLVGLVIPYLLIGVIGAGKTILPVTAGAFPELFKHANPMFNGGVPMWLSGLVICMVVLAYVFAGGSRGAAWANTFQTLVFMVMGVVAFFFIVNKLGGLEEAGKIVARVSNEGTIVQEYGFDKKEHEIVKLPQPKKIGSLGTLEEVDGDPAKVEFVPMDSELAKTFAGKQPHLSREVVEIVHKTRVDGKVVDAERELGVPWVMFLSYMFIPLSVGMFPHLFQHWLTARSANTFKLTLIAHPLCIMIVWVPCVLIGVWATGLLPPGLPPAAVLSNMLNILVESPVLTGLLTAGVLAAIMSSLDSQFLCLGTIFTNDIVLHRAKKGKYSEKQIIFIARMFIVAIVVITYLLALLLANQNVFDLAIWCFSGFAALTPVVIAALYWKRATAAGAMASVIAVLITWFIFFAMSGFGGEYTVGGVMPVAYCFLAGVVAMIVVSLMTKPPSQETVDKFFPNFTK
ncbi:MAG: SSS family solute:Na+ symporter [Verrucomicrobiales bacterium]|jgi:SSS family solute:Na+ symporter